MQRHEEDPRRPLNADSPSASDAPTAASRHNSAAAAALGRRQGSASGGLGSRPTNPSPLGTAPPQQAPQPPPGAAPWEVADADRVRAPPLATEEELLRFLSADFGDGTTTAAVPPDEAVGLMRAADGWCITRSGHKRVVHIESAATGIFHRTLEPAHGRGGGGGGAGDSANGGSEQHNNRRRSMLGSGGGGDASDGSGGAAHDGAAHGGGGSGGGGGGGRSPHLDGEALASELGVTVGELAVLRGGVLLAANWMWVQGLLAGVALLPVVVAALSSVTGREEFLDLYGRAAGIMRRVLFLLSTLALTGALDVCAQEARTWRAWRALPRARRRDLEASVALYAVCLVATLVCAATDAIVLDYAVTAEGGNWAATALQDPEFDARINSWLIASVVRCTVALAAWIMVCRRSYGASLEAIRTKHVIAAQHEAAAAAHASLCHLHGQGLEELSEVQLGDLVGTLQHGLEQAQATLDLRTRIIA